MEYRGERRKSKIKIMKLWHIPIYLVVVPLILLFIRFIFNFGNWTFVWGILMLIVIWGVYTYSQPEKIKN